MKRSHAVTPSDKGPRPGTDGLYKAADFYRGSNPDYEAPGPVRHRTERRDDGTTVRLVLVDGGIVFDAAQQGRK